MNAAADLESDSLALDSINISLNHRIVYATDLDNWGQVDYWSTPVELFGRGAGDCEDAALAKYFGLLAAGLPAKQLRLVYVLALAGGAGDLWQPHLVVAYLPSVGTAGDELILDTLLDEIRPLSRRPDLHVLISFDTEGVWPALERGPPARRASQIRPWARVIERMASVH